MGDACQWMWMGVGYWVHKMYVGAGMGEDGDWLDCECAYGVWMDACAHASK